MENLEAEITRQAEPPAKAVLNVGQQNAADAFFTFMLDPNQTEMGITGPPGTGKTFLMSQLIDKIMPQYFDMCKMMGIPVIYDNVTMTATTNKACQGVAIATKRNVDTIHSFLNLKVVDDYSTGKSKLTKTRNWTIHENKVLFVDEASLIDYDLRGVIREGTHNCKIVYVGDKDQLAPVAEAVSPVYTDGTVKHFELTEQMRNNKQPALMDLCQQFRHTVETGDFYPIRTVPGVIEHLDDQQLVAKIDEHFRDPEHNNRILAYTNERVVRYNDHIRTVRNLPDEFQIGEKLVNNSAIMMKSAMLSVEQGIEIIAQAATTEFVQIKGDAKLEVRKTDFITDIGDRFNGIPIPVDRNHFSKLIQYYRKQKDWATYFQQLKNKYPDLRQRDAATVYKAQGSTYHTVFVDLGNISTATQANQVARMLYVAFSRPTTKVYLYGQLADRYGGDVC